LHNSAAVLRHGQLPGDWVRAGIALYGSSPDHPEHASAHWQLQPTLSLNADIIGTQDLKAGDTVGYGSTFVAQAAMRIGIVACGYADGYPRICPTGTPVLVAGTRSQTLGRVSMDMLAVDLTPTPEANIGDEVTLWGRASAGAVLPIDEVAACAQTVGYELMCALAQRVPVTVEP
jgi:alanine racemase